MAEPKKTDHWNSLLETIGLKAPEPPQAAPNAPAEEAAVAVESAPAPQVEQSPVASAEEPMETVPTAPPTGFRAPPPMPPEDRTKQAAKPKAQRPTSHWSKLAGMLGLPTPVEPEIEEEAEPEPPARVEPPAPRVEAPRHETPRHEPRRHEPRASRPERAERVERAEPDSRSPWRERDEEPLGPGPRRRDMELDLDAELGSLDYTLDDEEPRTTLGKELDEELDEPITESRVDKDEDEDEPRRRRRRRRGRGRRGERRDEPVAPRDELLDELDEPEGTDEVDFAGFEEELESDLELDVAAPPPARERDDEEQEGRGRRRRRGRGRGRGRGDREGAVEGAREPVGREGAESGRGDRRRDEEPERPRRPARRPVDEEAAVEDFDLGDDEDLGDEENGHSAHKKIPTWQESVGVLIDNNMAARERNPDTHRGHHSRGRGRGRR